MPGITIHLHYGKASIIPQPVARFHLMEPKKSLTGIVTFKELYTYFGVSDKTMKSKLKPFRLFLNCPGQRKRTYNPNEVEFILQQLGDPKRNGSAPANGS